MNFVLNLLKTWFWFIFFYTPLQKVQIENNAKGVLLNHEMSVKSLYLQGPHMLSRFIWMIFDYRKQSRFTFGPRWSKCFVLNECFFLRRRPLCAGSKKRDFSPRSISKEVDTQILPWAWCDGNKCDWGEFTSGVRGVDTECGASSATHQQQCDLHLGDFVDECVLVRPERAPLNVPAHLPPPACRWHSGVGSPLGWFTQLSVNQSSSWVKFKDSGTYLFFFI
jgi:hypothetical protein